MCHGNAICNDTIGSYECTCKYGYTGDGKNCTGMYIRTYMVLNELTAVLETTVCIYRY